MSKLKKFVITIFVITLLISSLLVFKPTKIYAEESTHNGDGEELVSYTLGFDVSKHTISGYVTDGKTGDPIKKIKVTLKNPRGSSSNTKTDSKGYFKFESVLEGSYVIKVETDGYKDYEKNIEVNSNDVELDVALNLNIISGHVTDKKTGNPIENTKLTLNKESKSSLETITNSKGYFEFEYVSKGSNTLEIEKYGYSDYKKEVDVDSDEVKLTVDLKAEAEPCNISGYVTDKDTGEPVDNATIKLQGLPNWVNETDSNGYFKFESVSEGAYALRVEKECYREYVRSISANGVDTEVNIELEQEVKTYIGVEINSEKIVFDDSTGYPFIDENDRTLVPLRKALESFGAKVEWNNEKKLVSVTKDNNTVYIPLKEDYIIVNDAKIPTDSKAIIINERMYCPIRAIIEALEGVLTWDEGIQTIIIKDKEEI